MAYICVSFIENWIMKQIYHVREKRMTMRVNRAEGEASYGWRD